MKHEFTFFVEGEMIIITIEGRVKKIYVLKNKEKILESSYGLQKQIVSLEVSGHKIKIRYNPIPLMNGIEIYVDGKSLQGSASDPQAVARASSYGFVNLIGIVFLLTIIGGIKSYEGIVIKGFFISMWLLMYLATPKVPLVTFSLGLLYCVPNLLDVTVASITSHRNVYHYFWIFAYAVPTVQLIQGFIAAIKLKKIKSLAHQHK